MENSEILKLRDLLEANDITHTLAPHFGGYWLGYFQSGHCVCTVVQNPYSHGGDENLLEIEGLLTPEETELNKVAGYLTADEVFNRILCAEKSYRKIIGELG